MILLGLNVRDLVEGLDCWSFLIRVKLLFFCLHTAALYFSYTLAAPARRSLTLCLRVCECQPECVRSLVRVVTLCACVLPTFLPVCSCTRSLACSTANLACSLYLSGRFARCLSDAARCQLARPFACMSVSVLFQLPAIALQTADITTLTLLIRLAP